MIELFDYEVSIPGMKLESLNKAVITASMGARYAAAKKAKQQRGMTKLVLRSRFGEPPTPPATIVITRIGPRELDSDNAVGACKHCRDGVADWLGINDRSKLLTWQYEQSNGGRGVYGVKIRIFNWGGAT
jgi:hypothetical protein